MILSEIAESVMCDIIKIRLLSISFPTSPLFLLDVFYDVTLDTFKIARGRGFSVLKRVLCMIAPKC